MIQIRLPSLSLSNYHHKKSTDSGLVDMQMLRGDRYLKKICYEEQGILVF